MRRRLVTLALLALLAAACSDAAAEPPHRVPLEPAVSAQDGALAASNAYHAAIYAAAVDRAELVAYLTALAPPPAPTTSGVEIPQPMTHSAGPCGGATNGADQYLARESGSSADPVNQPNLGGSGAWGCYQIMPGTWAGSCGDLGSLVGSSAEEQAACASRLPLSAWSG